MFAALLVGTALAQRAFDFYSFGPYDESIPRPAKALGYEIGTTHTTFRDQERYIRAVAAAAPDQVKVEQYGTSTEGRPLRIVVIGSKQNMARLPEIEKQHEALAAGKGDPKSTVPILWINECIHGDETASFEAAMVSLYTLTASRNPAIMEALDKCLVILNPVYNPDGHERYVVFYNSIAVGSEEPEAFERRGPNIMFGRSNHYRFDMNRDRVAFSQKETQEEFAAMLRWAPQVYIDQHGQVGTYFMPPESQSVNENVDRARNSKWKDVFGRATAATFDKHGMAYFVKDTFDFFYPGYVDVSTTLSGAIGMTHETDGGRLLAEKRSDGSVLTLRQGIAKHFMSAMAVMTATADNGPGLLAEYNRFKRDAVSGKAEGKFQRVVVSGDRRALDRLAGELRFAGIVSYYSGKELAQDDAHDYWTGKRGRATFPVGSLVIDMNQPQGQMAKALLEPDASFEPEFVKAQVAKLKATPDGEESPPSEGAEFYDITAWSRPYAYSLKSWWCESRPPVSKAPYMPTDIVDLPTSVGYVLPYTDREDLGFVWECWSAGVRVSITSKPMKIDGLEFPAGSFVILADRNDDGYGKKVVDAARHHRSIGLHPIQSAYPDSDRYGPGSDAVVALKPAKIALVMGSRGNLADSGAAWFLFEKTFALPFTPVDQSFLNSQDLAKYTTVILPSGTTAQSKGRFADWVVAGGTAVVLGDPDWAIGQEGFADLEPIKGKYRDLPGSLFRTEMDHQSFLTFGYAEGPGSIAFPLSGSTFWHAEKSGGSVVRLTDMPKAKKLLSGWQWPGETEKELQGAVLVHDQSVGRGHVILFTHDPTERAMWPGLYKLFLNAASLGPSF